MTRSKYGEGPNARYYYEVNPYKSRRNKRVAYSRGFNRRAGHTQPVSPEEGELHCCPYAAGTPSAQAWQHGYRAAVAQESPEQQAGLAAQWQKEEEAEES